MACRAHLGEVLTRYDAIVRQGGEVLAVSFSGPERLRAYLARHPQPCRVAADPSLTAYCAFELGRTSWLAMLHPMVLLRYGRKMLRGWVPERPAPKDDLLQLGGDFVIDRRRRLAFVYRSKEPTDRPSVEAVMNAVREAHESCLVQ